MAYEQKDNSGSIFKNRNPKSDKSPPLTGSVMAGGVEYWVNAWTKIDKNGEKWISIALNPKNPSGAQAQSSAPAQIDLEEDSIPF